MLLNQFFSISRVVFDLHFRWFNSFPFFSVYLITGYFINKYHSVIGLSNRYAFILLLITLFLSIFLNYFFASSLNVISDYLILSNTGVINYFITTLIFYIFCKNKHIFKENLIIASISSASFGIYLVHPIYLSFFKKVIPQFVDTSNIAQLIIAFATFLLSYISINMIKRVRLFNKIC
jgi:surface polysaccharide O-acyltransferase-like enzyme